MLYLSSQSQHAQSSTNLICLICCHNLTTDHNQPWCNLKIPYFMSIDHSSRTTKMKPNSLHVNFKSMSKSNKTIKERKERGSSRHSTGKALNPLAQQKPPTSVQPSASRRDTTRSRPTVNSGAPRLPAYDKKGSTNGNERD